MNGQSNAGVVIVGGGQGGLEVAAALRSSGYEHSVTLISSETDLPYSRPGLSKGYLLEDSEETSLQLRPPEFYEQQRIELVLGTAVTEIDRARRCITTADGRIINFDALLLATGGAARTLEGAPTATNVHYVRTFADARRLKPALRVGQKVLVVGAGYVGLEVAAAARQLGADVTLVHRGRALLQRVTSTPVSDFFTRIHREEGVKLRLEVTPSGYEMRDDRVCAVLLSDGTRIEAETLVIGVGLAPRTDLASSAGLDVADGILVDDDCRTSDPGIFAIGDCARYPCDVTGMTRRLESVPNASAHARTVAAAVLGRPRPTPAVPWFWSDQYDVKMQVAGLFQASDDVIVRGDDQTGRSFSVAYVRDGRLMALDAINQPRDFAAAKRLITTRARVDRNRLADPSIPLKDAAISLESPVFITSEPGVNT